MEDIGPSLRCPECSYGLFTASFLNLEFFRKSSCPYCGAHVRWALSPIFGMLFGIVTSGIGAYFLGDRSLVPAELAMLPASAFGIGFCIILLSLLCLRFKVLTPKTLHAATKTRSYYPGAS